MNNATNRGAIKPLLAVIGLVVLLAIGVGAYAGLNMSRQRSFLDRARSASREAAAVDYDFSKLLESSAHSRDQVIDQSSTSAKRIGELCAELGNMSAGGAGELKQSLCKALDDHQKVYEAIGDSAKTGDMTQVSQAVESAWQSYGKVDGKQIPVAGVLPGLAADSLMAGLASMKGAPPIAAKPQPQPAAPSEAETPPIDAVADDAAAAPVLAVPAPAPAKPAAVAKAVKKKPVVAKKRKPVRTKTATYRCPHRGCNAWFVKSSLLQRHKKFCVYRPGGPAARARRR